MTSKALLFAALMALAQADNDFKIVADPGVSAQMLFVGSAETVYIVDKTENNPARVAGHAAWAAEWNVKTNANRSMDILTNAFCAAGAPTGAGEWINAGGNNPITTGGVTINATTGDAYKDADGGLALRTLTPCDDQSCEWVDSSANYMNSRRWYPTTETLSDGVVMIIGGDMYGGFVNNIDGSQNTPSYEFFPKSSGKTRNFDLEFLNYTLPANLYPLVWMVPSGKVFMQANWQTILYDLVTHEETRLPNITHAVATYPASAATAMLSQTKDNNWTAPIMFCGGGDFNSQDWVDHGDDTDWFRAHPLSAACRTITPTDETATWEDEDDLPEARSMGNLIGLPDGRYLLINGIASGVAGYDKNGWPYGTDPIYTPAYFDPSAPAGQRWNRDGIQNASLPRLYHSTAVLLADGSVAVAGSNPYPDFTRNGSRVNAGDPRPENAEWWSETRIEIFYPDYYSLTRPQPSGMPTTIGYGGAAFQVTLPAASVAGLTNADNAKFVIVRTGFSTHALNMGQRRVELETSVVSNSDGSATMNVAPLPANAHVLAPGPAYAFVVINGVPSQGQFIMVGSGAVEEQTLGAYPTLPASSFTASPSASSIAAAASASQFGSRAAAESSSASHLQVSFLAVILAFALFLR